MAKIKEQIKNNISLIISNNRNSINIKTTSFVRCKNRIYSQQVENPKLKLNKNSYKDSFIISNYIGKVEQKKRGNLQFIYSESSERVIFDNNLEDTRQQEYLEASMQIDNRIKTKQFFGKNIIDFFEAIYKNEYIDLFKKETIKQNELKSFTEKVNYLLLKGSTTAYIFHELIGHMLEEDIYSGDSILRHISFPENIIVENISEPFSQFLGLGSLDDRGDIIKNEVLIKENEIISEIGKGNYRQEDFFKEPLPRMKTIKVSSNINENIPFDTNDYLEIQDFIYGSVNPQTGDIKLFATEGYLSGLFPIKNVRIFGKINNIIENLIIINQNFQFKIATCIKKGQKIPVGLFSPDSILYTKNLRVLYERK